MASVGFLLGIALGRGSASPEDAEENPVRRRLLELVRRHLGINETCLQREIGFKRGAVRHHLRSLEKAGLLRRVPVGRESHYFPMGTDPKRMDQFATASHGRAKAVLREIFRDPGIPQYELAERVGMTRKILRHHLDFLASHGLLRERRDARSQRYYPGDSLDPLLREQVLGPECPGDPPFAKAAPRPGTRS